MVLKRLISRITATAGHFRTKREDRTDRDSLDIYLQEFEDWDYAKAQTDWLSEYRKEMRGGNKILQREMHLSAKISYLTNLADEQGPLEPSQLNELHECDQELKQLSRDYLQHQQRILDLENSKPPGRLVRDYFTIRHRRPGTLWKAERIQCRLRGGCCARECGCCEQWSAIRDPSGKSRHMHCIGDCSCCERHRALNAPGRNSNLQSPGEEVE